MTILWFGIYDPDFGRNKIYMQALRKAGHRIIECRDNSAGFLKYIRLWNKHRAYKDAYDVMVVGYPGHVVTPLAKFISNKKVIVDALGSLYDAEIHSHRAGILRRIKNRVADRLMVKYADIILLESNAQKAYFEVHFGKSQKYEVVYTGTWDIFEKEVEDRFSGKSQVNKKFTVLFRGKLTPECGIMHILGAARILKDDPNILFKIVGAGYFKEKLESYVLENELSNVKYISRYLSDNELVDMVRSADISLGQFEQNPRLNRTIPHKAFESFAAGAPYMTGDAPAIREIVTDGQTAILVPLSNAQALADKIKFAISQPSLLRDISERSMQLYKDLFSQSVLAGKLASLML